MSDDLTLGIPKHPDEPKPWSVVIWRYHTSTWHHFRTREAAIRFARFEWEASIDYGDRAVGGIYRPEGGEDKEAALEATS